MRSETGRGYFARLPPPCTPNSQRTHGEPFGLSGRSALVSPRFAKLAAPVVVSTLQFSQQLCEQLHASVPALAHAVYSSGETRDLRRARLVRYPRETHLGSSAVFFKRHRPQQHPQPIPHHRSANDVPIL